VTAEIALLGMIFTSIVSENLIGTGEYAVLTPTALFFIDEYDPVLAFLYCHLCTCIQASWDIAMHTGHRLTRQTQIRVFANGINPTSSL
jgi:hypothetical protein